MEELFPDTAFVFGLYTNLCTDMQNRVRVITQCNDDFEFLLVSNNLLSGHGTEPAGLWKNSYNRSRVCFGESVTELRILHFSNWVPPFASRLPQSFDESSCNPSTSMIILCNKAMHLTISTTVSTFVSVDLSRILHSEEQIPKTSKITFYNTSYTRQSVIKYSFTSV